jgi:peptide/nickel transport system permease protein
VSARREEAPSALPRPYFAWSAFGRWLGGVASAVATVLGVASVVFFAFRLLPGDPAALVLGDEAGEAERAALRHALHLDEPLGRQYAQFLVDLLHGRAGASLRHPGVDAFRLVGDALPSTALLATCAVALGALFGLSVALLAVGARGVVARAAHRVLVLSASVPLLAFAPAATWLLAVRLRLVPLPADPDAGAAGLLFAAALLAIPLGAAVGRIARAALREAARGQYLQVARAKGRSEVAVWIVHALPVCAGPIVTVVAAQLGALLGGAIVLERLLERRGLGTLLAEALATRDLPVLEAAVIASAGLFVAAQLLGARLHAALDPRVR